MTTIFSAKQKIKLEYALTSQNNEDESGSKHKTVKNKQGNFLENASIPDNVNDEK